jgi:hypothetical protein
MKNLSNWRSVRVLEGRIERELRRATAWRCTAAVSACSPSR